MQSIQNDPPVFFHLRWVAKVALIVGITASIGLLLAIYFTTNDEGADYAHVIANRSLTQKNLGDTLLVFGLALVLVSAITTWFISLYSSFRIAGPLFRFCQNLKDIIDDAFSIPLAIRKSDLLQREWAQFDASQARLRDHYANLSQALAACEQALQSGAEPGNANQQMALARLQEVERLVQL